MLGVYCCNLIIGMRCLLRVACVCCMCAGVVVRCPLCGVRCVSFVVCCLEFAVWYLVVDVFVGVVRCLFWLLFAVSCCFLVVVRCVWLVFVVVC